MKKITFSSILLALAFAALAQNAEPEKFAQVSLRKMTLSETKQVTEILASLYPMAGSYNDHWASRSEILSTSVEGLCNKQKAEANCSAGTFNAIQKSIFENSDVGSILNLKISYKEKDLFTNEFGEIKNMHFAISVMPDIDALYPGGIYQVVEYFRGNVLRNSSPSDSTLISEKLKMAVIKFTVDEAGKVIDARMDKSSTDESIDKLLLEASATMPAWTPARSVKGVKMKREFSVSVDKRKNQGGC